MSLKDPVTPPEIDPGTIRLVAQRLNHYATTGPHFLVSTRGQITCIGAAKRSGQPSRILDLTTTSHNLFNLICDFSEAFNVQRKMHVALSLILRKSK
jgi:hypothetical protein